MIVINYNSNWNHAHIPYDSLSRYQKTLINLTDNKRGTVKDVLRIFCIKILTTHSLHLGWSHRKGRK